VVSWGPPEQVARAKASRTGAYLRPVLERASLRY
jgi:excinuclease UvrABC ATPase subunit